MEINKNELVSGLLKTVNVGGLVNSVLSELLSDGKIDKADFKKMMEENIKIIEASNLLIDVVLEPALKAVVAKTDNTFDDVLVATLYPLLEKELKAAIAKLVAKLFVDEQK